MILASRRRRHRSLGHPGTDGPFYFWIDDGNRLFRYDLTERARTSTK
jgi:hypothetical protein